MWLYTIIINEKKRKERIKILALVISLTPKYHPRIKRATA